jgi:acyl carrier protein
MDGNSIRTKIKEIVIAITHSSDDVEDIDDGDFLIDDLGIDSLGMINLVQTLQKQFDIRIPESDVTLQNFRSVELLGDYIESRTGKD